MSLSHGYWLGFTALWNSQRMATGCFRLLICISAAHDSLRRYSLHLSGWQVYSAPRWDECAGSPVNCSRHEVGPCWGHVPRPRHRPIRQLHSLALFPDSPFLCMSLRNPKFACSIPPIDSPAFHSTFHQLYIHGCHGSRYGGHRPRIHRRTAGNEPCGHSVHVDGWVPCTLAL